MKEELFKLSAGLGPMATTLGLMKPTGTAVDAFIALAGTVAVGWVLLTLVGTRNPRKVRWRNVS